MSITIQEACRRFLDELDEKVPRPVLERHMKALNGLVEYLHGEHVTEVDQLDLERIEDFLSAGYPVEQAIITDLRDLWTALRRFVKWLDRRKLVWMQAEFSRRERALRDMLFDRF